ncbi:uncharacterized protein LOC116199790 isoform X3 [Punica granatum]|uniref:Uncharacterized protein LOC116199790 isoform X3 n=1 Tax=Punica granatum TaxID=22663 RepID=A0A6P8CR08_PUNGR|nr:uncharacterized protein LOC116199790 isoform X3 [Punica granatum]
MDSPGSSPPGSSDFRNSRHGQLCETTRVGQEWRYGYPLLEEAGLETWAIDILGWGFSDLKRRPPCNVASKREHLYRMWKAYIKKPMILVGPSLGAAVAIDFAVAHPEAVSASFYFLFAGGQVLTSIGTHISVSKKTKIDTSVGVLDGILNFQVEKLVLIDASVYTEGTGKMSSLPKALAYAGVAILKSFPLRFYVNVLAFNGLPVNTNIDWANIGRLHCRYPWWEDATVDFMLSGGYNVTAQIGQVKQRTLIIWGQDDKIIDSKLAERLHCELPSAILHQIPDCGHIPHVEKPGAVVKLITEFVLEEDRRELLLVSQPRDASQQTDSPDPAPPLH